MLFSAVVALASATVAYAVDHPIAVGDGGALTFTPSSVNIAQGDNLIFEFRSKNHSVTQSTFANPCTPLTTSGQAVNSGFMPVPQGATQFPTWNITIDNTTAPLWFFCAQTAPVNHCTSGMVFAINPTAEKSFETFQANAKSGASGATGGSSSGSPPPTGTFSGFVTSTNSASATDGSNAPQQTNTNNNGALRLGGSAGGVLALVGLVMGLMV